MRSRFLISPCVLLVCATLAPAADLPRPRLVLETTGELTSVWVDSIAADGATARTLLRVTPAGVAPGVTGRDPAGRAAFATWTEDSLDRWFAYSRDAGRTWSEARPLRDELRLRDGATPPGVTLPPVAEGFELPGTGRLFLVQFHTIGLPEWRAALEASGAEPLAFFPHNAWIVRMPPGFAASVAALEFVQRVEAFHPWYRLEPELRDWIRDGGDDAEQRRVRVMAFEWGPGGKARIADAAEALGARIAAYWPSGHVLELLTGREQLRRLAAHDEVAWIDRWSPPETDMNLVRQDSGADAVESGFGYCGDGVRGEVLDSGIQELHQDFDGIMLHGPHDTESHGTSTYGIVFGNGDRDGDGDATATGHMPCPGAQGIFADYETLGDRFAHTEELKQSPYFASFQTNSWGNARTTQYNSASSEMDDIIWRLDIAILQSQSNSGNQSSRPQAWAKNIISVGGVRHYNTLDTADDAWANGASVGPAADGRIKPDLHYWYDSIRTTTTGGGYTSGFGGTSAATPEAAGVVGLMVQLWADNLWGTDPQGASVFEKQPHASTIKALAINNARQYPFLGTTHDLTRTHQGWGRPNVELAQQRAANSFVVDEQQPLTLGQQASYDIIVPAGESELKVTMVYPDPPGTTSSTLHRINDLNLKVISPSGPVFHGNNGLDAGNYSTAGGSPNSVDTVENVFIENPEAGTWTVEVEAFEINQDAHTATPVDDAVFALVVTGGKIAGVCGNGVLEFGEDCDGADIGGVTCQQRGCTGGGTLGCSVDCVYDTSQCFDCPVCGDGACDIGEDCQRCGADCVSQSAQVCGNGLCETADGEDCVSCPDDCNGIQSGKPANRFCCGDGDGENPVDCSDDRCNSGGNLCTTAPSLDYCCGDAVCESDETIANCALDCAPPTPGEAGGVVTGDLRVTGYDPGTGMLSITYGPACSADDAAIEYAELTRANLESYAWSGQQCGLGNTGSYEWDVSTAPASLFFVVVGQTADAEGSYGTDSSGSERDEDAGGAVCPRPQTLTDPCDAP